MRAAEAAHYGVGIAHLHVAGGTANKCLFAGRPFLKGDTICPSYRTMTTCNLSKRQDLTLSELVQPGSVARVATRDISQGEELCTMYGTSYRWFSSDILQALYDGDREGAVGDDEGGSGGGSGGRGSGSGRRRRRTRAKSRGQSGAAG